MTNLIRNAPPLSPALQGCVETEISGQRGILTIGGYYTGQSQHSIWSRDPILASDWSAAGYYNGRTSMFLPLEDAGGRSLEIFGLARNMPRWEYVGGLSKVPMAFDDDYDNATNVSSRSMQRKGGSSV